MGVICLLGAHIFFYFNAKFIVGWGRKGESSMGAGKWERFSSLGVFLAILILVVSVHSKAFSIRSTSDSNADGWTLITNGVPGGGTFAWYPTDGNPKRLFSTEPSAISVSRPKKERIMAATTVKKPSVIPKDKKQLPGDPKPEALPEPMPKPSLPGDPKPGPKVPHPLPDPIRKLNK